MTRTNVGLALDACNGAPFVRADCIDRGERGGVRSRDQEYARGGFDEHCTADVGQWGPRSSDLHGGARESSRQHTEF